MSNAIATISREIYSARDSFVSVLTDRSLNFEREAEFAIQAITPRQDDEAEVLARLEREQAAARMVV